MIQHRFSYFLSIGDFEALNITYDCLQGMIMIIV